jgi:hypothetical protein
MAEKHINRPYFAVVEALLNIIHQITTEGLVQSIPISALLRGNFTGFIKTGSKYLLFYSFIFA